MDDLVARLANPDAVTKVSVLSGSTLDEVAQQWRQAAADGADMVEWRIDYLDAARGQGSEGGQATSPETAPDAPCNWLGAVERDLEVSAQDAQWLDAADRLVGELRQETGIPVLVTFRTDAEGGALPAADAKRYRSLVRDAAAWADAVDVELIRPGADDLVAQLAEQAVVVASFHSFQGGVDEAFLKETLQLMAGLGAGVLKVAWQADDVDDLETVLDVQVWAKRNLDVPTVVIGMGDLGRATRLGEAAKRSAMVFCAPPDSPSPQALGQPTLAEVTASIAELDIADLDDELDDRPDQDPGA